MPSKCHLQLLLYNKCMPIMNIQALTVLAAWVFEWNLIKDVPGTYK